MPYEEPLSWHMNSPGLSEAALQPIPGFGDHSIVRLRRLYRFFRQTANVKDMRRLRRLDGFVWGLLANLNKVLYMRSVYTIRTR